MESFVPTRSCYPGAQVEVQAMKGIFSMPHDVSTHTKIHASIWELIRMNGGLTVGKSGGLSFCMRVFEWLWRTRDYVNKLIFCLKRGGYWPSFSRCFWGPTAMELCLNAPAWLGGSACPILIKRWGGYLEMSRLSSYSEPTFPGFHKKGISA